jgi:hypothetical protein
LLQEKCSLGGSDDGGGGGRRLLSVALSRAVHAGAAMGARVLLSDDGTDDGGGGDGGGDDDGSCLGTPKLVITIECLIIACTPIFYQGFLEFVRQVSNPFGDDWIDLPTLHMQHGLDAHLQAR